MRGALFLLLAAGCGFQSVGNDDGSVGDMGVAGGGGADLTGVPPGADLAGGGGGGGGGPCAAPQLLVGVENLHNGDTGGGRIARLSLAGDGAQPCGTLRGQGLIGAQPLAVAAFGGYVAAGTLSGLYAVDPDHDVVKWSKPNPNAANYWGPFDVFALENPSGQPVVAVTYGDLSSSGAGIRKIEAFDPAGKPVAAQPWCIQGVSCTGLPLSLSIYSMAANPAAPSHLLALDGANNVAAWDVNPWTQTKTQYIGSYSEYLTSIYAVGVGTTRHIVWFDNNMAGGAIQWAIDTGVGTPALNGPLKCSSGCATLLDVVPDPTAVNGFFALCEGATVDTRQIVRVSEVGVCTPVLDGAQFGAESRLSRLGLGL